MLQRGGLVVEPGLERGGVAVHRLRAAQALVSGQHLRMVVIQGMLPYWFDNTRNVCLCTGRAQCARRVAQSGRDRRTPPSTARHSVHSRARHDTRLPNGNDVQIRQLHEGQKP